MATWIYTMQDLAIVKIYFILLSFAPPAPAGYRCRTKKQLFEICKLPKNVLMQSFDVQELHHAKLITFYSPALPWKCWRNSLNTELYANSHESNQHKPLPCSFNNTYLYIQAAQVLQSKRQNSSSPTASKNLTSDISIGTTTSLVSGVVNHHKSCFSALTPLLLRYD